MERNIQKNGLINLFTMLVMGVAGFSTARYADSLAGQVAMSFAALGLLVAFVSWFQMRLEENERLEKLEYEELSKSKGGSTLFESKGAEVFPAQHSREQFERFFVPVFTVLLLIGQGVGAYLLWRWVAKASETATLKQPMVAMALFGLFALILFMIGKFSSTLARLERHRLLRPSASYVLLNAYLCFVVALGIVGVEAGFARTDVYVARALCVLLGLVAVENLVALILEIYRPRVKGRIGRPIYDSRLVGLLGQPESLVTAAAQALDYQFGFKVSETWFFQFLGRALQWLLLLQLAVLFLSTMVVFIDPGEQAILERFGKPVAGRAILNPGMHFKWPWPIDQVYRFYTDRIQSFDVGFQETPQSRLLHTVLWSTPHGKEENFVVANRATATVTTNRDENTLQAPPVSLLSVRIPVQYQITNVLYWAYNNDAPTNLLEDVANGEVVRYLVSVDLNALMTSNRLAAAETLRERIQEAANEHRLGVRIFYVGLEGIHPPVKVAPDYEKVVSAQQIKESKILDAQAEAFRTNELAGAEAFTTTNQAMALRQKLEVSSLARAALFTNQIPAFEAAPGVYRQRVYFKMFADATADARKYVILTTNARDVVVFDLQQHIRSDLLNLSVPSPESK